MFPELVRRQFMICPVALFIMSPEEKRRLSLIPPPILPLFVMGPPERLMFPIDPLFVMRPLAEIELAEL
jgi:hypothetical protein